MFKTLKLISPVQKQLAPSKKSFKCYESIYFRSSYNMSFMNMNFFNGDKTSKKGKKKKTNIFFKKASKAFGQGFFKGPDFFAVEQSLASREANRLHLKAQECRKLKDYPQALIYYRMAFAVLKEYYDEDEPILAFYHQKVGDIHLEKDDMLAAVENFKFGLDVLIEAFGEEDLRVAKQYLLIGKYQMKERVYVEAVQNLHEALDIYLKNSNDHQKAVTSCYAKLAESYLHIGKYEEALENFESLIAFNKQEEEIPFLSQSYENFAITLAYAKHKYDEALLYLQKCLSKEMLLNGGSSLSSGNCYLKIGQINTMQGRYQEAMESYEKALEISKLIGGSNHRQTGSCYNAIGAAFLGQGKYTEAMEYFKMALNCFDEKDLEIYACYKNIAMTCFRQNRYDTALTNFEHSIEERSKILDFFTEVDAECGALHGFLASLYIRNKNYSGAVEHYEQFFEIFFKLLCKQTWRSIENSHSAE